MDFLPQVTGLDSYKDCKKNSSIMIVGDHQIAVLSYDDLMKNKQAVGRTIDKEDITALEQKRKELGGK